MSYMAEKYTQYKKVFEKHDGFLRVSEAIRLGVPEHIVYEMVQKDELVKDARGVYRLADSEMPGNPDLVQVSLLVPKGVICLISALYFYELTTQIPHSVYIALPQNAGRPRLKYPPLEVFWVTNSLHSVGVDVHVLDGVKVKIYDREKTVADCFKFRNRVGDDVALEALKDYVSQPKLDVQKLLEYAKVDRVEKLMMPYLKSLSR
jgi:predicted transcriptional regulator of viral defense system